LKVEKGFVRVSFSDIKVITRFGINYRNDNNVRQVVEIISTSTVENSIFEFQLSLTQNEGSSLEGLTPFRQKTKYKAAKRIKKMIKCQSAQLKIYRQIHMYVRLIINSFRLVTHHGD